MLSLYSPTAARSASKHNAAANLLLASILLVLLLISYFQYASYATMVSSTQSASPIRSSQRHHTNTTHPSLLLARLRRQRQLQRRLALVPTTTSTTPTPQPGSPFSFRLEERDGCAGWTFRGVLFPSHEQRLALRRNGTLLHANWDGLIPLDIFYPFHKACDAGTVAATEKQATSNINALNVLCHTYPHHLGTDDGGGGVLHEKVETEEKEERTTKTNRTTLVFEIIDDYRMWEHIVRDVEHLGLNLWHFHVDYFPLWLAIRRVEVTMHLARKNQTLSSMKGTVFPSRLKPIVDLVIVYPDSLLQRFQDVSVTTPVVYDGSNALQLHERGGKFSSLAGIQGIHDGLHVQSKVVIARYSTTATELYNVLTEHGMNARPAAWVKPVHPTFLMWMLERKDLEGELDQCKDSVYAQYATHLLNSVPIRRRAHRAAHVCLVSRQLRAKANAEQPFLSRNLVPQAFLELVKRLSSPIVLSPHIFVRDGGAEPVPSDLQHSSVTGQMRFVHQECAVLVGVHGAGLSNLFGMRPGTHVIEFVSAFNYTIYKNTALLMNNVSYTRIMFDAELVSRDHHHEANFTLPQDKLVKAVEVINKALKESLVRQDVLNREVERVARDRSDGDEGEFDEGMVSDEEEIDLGAFEHTKDEQ